jgi:hypothetical protein
MIRSKYRSRKTMKKALHLKQSGGDGIDVEGPTGIPGAALGILDALKQTFGLSKHRGARVQRFESRQRGKR